MSFSRGAVWFVDIPGVGEKPALIVSWQPIQQALGAAIVARITSVKKRRSLPTTVYLTAGEGGLEEPGHVLCHDLFTLERSVFRRYSGTLGPTRLVEVEDALRRALDLVDGSARLT
jgi:mRNA interferase MazF